METQSLAGTTIALGGYVLSGFGDAEAINVKPASDAFTKLVGSDGTVERAYTGDETFEITISLLPSSQSNAILTTLHEADLAAIRAGASGAVVSFTWKGRGLDLFVAAEAWIAGKPEVKVSKGVEVRQWKLQTGRGKLALGS